MGRHFNIYRQPEPKKEFVSIMHGLRMHTRLENQGALGGSIFSAWATLAIWEILKAPIIIELSASASGAIRALTFALIAIGITLIVR